MDNGQQMANDHNSSFRISGSADLIKDIPCKWIDIITL